MEIRRRWTIKGLTIKRKRSLKSSTCLAQCAPNTFIVHHIIIWHLTAGYQSLRILRKAWSVESVCSAIVTLGASILPVSLDTIPKLTLLLGAAAALLVEPVALLHTVDADVLAPLAAVLLALGG